MAVAASKLDTKENPPARGQIKIKIFSIIAKSVVQISAMCIAGGKKKVAGNGGGESGCFSSKAAVIPLETGGGFKSATRRKIEHKPPRRGQIKIKIFKIIAKSVVEAVGLGFPRGNKKGTRHDGGGVGLTGGDYPNGTHEWLQTRQRF